MFPQVLIVVGGIGSGGEHLQSAEIYENQMWGYIERAIPYGLAGFILQEYRSSLLLLGK